MKDSVNVLNEALEQLSSYLGMPPFNLNPEDPLLESLAAEARDITHVVWEELITANNVRPVSPGDTVGALSFIVDRSDIPGHADLEAIVVKTLGVAGISPAVELAETVLPNALLAPDVGGGSRYDDICLRYGPAALEGRIVGEVLRRMVRIKPAEK